MTRQRIDNFHVEDGHMLRNVVPLRGASYCHRCSLENYLKIVLKMEELGSSGFVSDELYEILDRRIAHSQICVVLAFLKERGLIEVRFKRNFAESLHLDAMTEYHALAHECDQPKTQEVNQ